MRTIKYEYCYQRDSVGLLEVSLMALTPAQLFIQCKSGINAFYDDVMQRCQKVKIFRRKRTSPTLHRNSAIPLGWKAHQGRPNFQKRVSSTAFPRRTSAQSVKGHLITARQQRGNQVRNTCDEYVGSLINRYSTEDAVIVDESVCAKSATKVEPIYAKINRADKVYRRARKQYEKEENEAAKARMDAIILRCQNADPYADDADIYIDIDEFQKADIVSERGADFTVQSADELSDSWWRCFRPFIVFTIKQPKCKCSS